MSDEYESASTVFPTRRALREAERQAALSRQRNPSSDVSSAAAAKVAASTVTASTARASRRGVAPRHATADVAKGGAPAAIAAAGPVRGAFIRQWVPKLAVLGSLAIATTAIPLSGAGMPSAASTSASYAASSALDVLAAEQADGTDVFDTSASLAADPMAAARTVLSADRTQGRDALVCGSAELEANGQVTAGVAAEPVQIMMPLQAGYRVTSLYGYRWGGMHEGLDMADSAGTPIHAVAAGEVAYTGYGLAGRSGMIIVLKHEIEGETFWTWYIHMYPDGIFVEVGDRVAAGEVIGEVGSYGNSTGPHLHLEVHVDDKFTTVDPAKWLKEHDAVPLTAENLACAAS